MKKYLVKTPNLVKFLLRNWVWSFSSKDKVLYLTFDDGPTPEITNWTLNLLQEYNAKATFFCIGKNIEENPSIYQKIIEQNHSIGNHTNNHLNGFKTKNSTYIKNIEFSENNTTTTSKLFRPPYGKITFSQAKKIRKKGFKIIMWDVLSADFDTTIDAEECLKNVVKNTQNGSIIVFHDSLKAQEKLQFVLPKVLDYYTSKGYCFKAID
jgi:peptidoglycan/xylan/chitin deacetylase (PgdA/CDA1 family)